MQIRLTTDAPGRKTAKSSDRKKAKSLAGSDDMRVKSPFESILDEVLPPENDSDVDLHELWSSLPELENQLIESPTDKNLKAYRDLIKAILKETIQRNTAVRKLVRKGRSGGEYEMNVVSIVDERLQKMIYAIRSPGNTAFQILKNIEEIRGMLLDIKANY